MGEGAGAAGPGGPGGAEALPEELMIYSQPLEHLAALQVSCTRAPAGGGGPRCSQRESVRAPRGPGLDASGRNGRKPRPPAPLRKRDFVN